MASSLLYFWLKKFNHNFDQKHNKADSISHVVSIMFELWQHAMDFNLLEKLFYSHFTKKSSTNMNFAFSTTPSLQENYFPYWKFNTFNFEIWDDTECRTELRFAKKDLDNLAEALEIPEKFVCRQRIVCSGIEWKGCV